MADPNSTQDACHMNFAMGLARHRVSVAQWLSGRASGRGPEGLRFDFLWGLRILCPTLVTRRI